MRHDYQMWALIRQRSRRHLGTGSFLSRGKDFTQPGSGKAKVRAKPDVLPGRCLTRPSSSDAPPAASRR